MSLQILTGQENSLADPTPKILPVELESPRFKIQGSNSSPSCADWEPVQVSIRFKVVSSVSRNPLRFVVSGCTFAGAEALYIYNLTKEIEVYHAGREAFQIFHRGLHNLLDGDQVGSRPIRGSEVS